MIIPFNFAWWCVMCVTLLLCFVLWFFRRGKDNRKILLALSWATLGFLVLYRLALYFDPTYKYDFWYDLPMHLCNIIVYVAIIAMYIKNEHISRILKGACFYIGVVCAPFALAMPSDSFGNVPVFSAQAIGYYGFHCLVVILCMSICTLGAYKVRYRDIPEILGFLLVITFAVHLFNTFLRSGIAPQVNYFYTYGLPGNIILDTLQSWIPYSFVWMLPLAPFVALVWTFITFLIKLPNVFRLKNSNVTHNI